MTTISAWKFNAVRSAGEVLPKQAKLNRDFLVNLRDEAGSSGMGAVADRVGAGTGGRDRREPYRLQDGTDPDAVRADLTSTVHRALEPAHVSLRSGRMPR
jgi:hypothetical protein